MENKGRLAIEGEAAMLRIIVLVFPAIVLLSACESIKDALGPPEEGTPMTADEARAALSDRGIPYSQASFIAHAEKGDLEVVKLFIAAGLDINVQPYTAVSVYVPKRDDPTSLTHLESVWYPQEGDQHDDTALMKAAGAGHIAVVEFLVESGADVFAKNTNHQYALMFAAAGGHLDVVEYLFTCEDSRGRHCNTVIREVEFDPTSYPYDSFPKTAVQWAAYNGHLDVVAYFAEWYVRWDVPLFPWYVLGWAALAGHLDVVAYMTEVIVQGLVFPDANTTLPITRWSSRHVVSSASEALVLASYAGHVDVVRFLLAQGHADLFYRFKRWMPIQTPEGVLYFEEIGGGAMHMAIDQGHDEILRLLLEHWMITYGADGRDPHGVTALMYAAAGGDIEMANTLLDNGTPINAQTDVGTTALIFAAATGRVDMVQLLLDRGADPSVENAHGYTALSLAEERQHQEVVDLLQNSS